MAVIILPLKTMIASWRLLLIMYCLPASIGLLGLCFLPESPKFHLSKGKTTQSLNTMRKAFAINTRRQAEYFPCHSQNFEIQNRIEDLNFFKNIGNLFRNGRQYMSIQLALTGFLLNFVSGGVSMWLPTILRSILDNRGLTICEPLKFINGTITTDTCSDPNPSDQRPYQLLVLIGGVALTLYICSVIVVTKIGRKNVFGM